MPSKDSNINEKMLFNGDAPRLSEIAKVIPYTTLQEYIKTYAPDTRANVCCFRCSKFAGGCSWSHDFTPVDGWIATEGRESTQYANGKPWYKIYYCPQYEKQKKHTKRHYDDVGIQNLAVAIFESAGTEYRNAIEALKMFEAEIRRSRKGGVWKDRKAYELSISGYVHAYDDLIFGRTGLCANVYESMERKMNFKPNKRLTDFCLKWQAKKHY